MLSFTNVGYVWQILERGVFLPPHPWAAPKKPILNRVKGFCDFSSTLCIILPPVLLHLGLSYFAINVLPLESLTLLGVGNPTINATIGMRTMVYYLIPDLIWQIFLSLKLIGDLKSFVHWFFALICPVHFKLFFFWEYLQFPYLKFSIPFLAGKHPCISLEPTKCVPTSYS